ncbi:MAG: hypothetical protein IIC24_02445 [Chloroflexi bacterium]|nr:hypothetical protein [Chloroflexota bacterium]
MADNEKKSQNKRPPIIPDLRWTKESRDDLPPRDPNKPIPENPLIALKRKRDSNESNPTQGAE